LADWLLQNRQNLESTRALRIARDRAGRPGFVPWKNEESRTALVLWLPEARPHAVAIMVYAAMRRRWPASRALLGVPKNEPGRIRKSGRKNLKKRPEDSKNWPGRIQKSRQEI